MIYLIECLIFMLLGRLKDDSGYYIAAAIMCVAAEYYRAHKKREVSE